MRNRTPFRSAPQPPALPGVMWFGVRARHDCSCGLPKQPPAEPGAGCARRTRHGFTLVELLVVITIIGILASLITSAAVKALEIARRNRIKLEMDQMDTGLQTFKSTYLAYPPNAQVDGAGTENPVDESQVLTDFKRHFKQAFPQNKEPKVLIAALVGLQENGALLPNGDNLQGGMSAGETLVFWLGGFSTDPKYPISGEGGPSYDVTGIPPEERAKRDPLQRTWIFTFVTARLQPRTIDNFFDESDSRFIEYQVNVNGVPQTRRINFWQYTPSQSEQPYLYFDASRHPAAVVVGANVTAPFDPPAASSLNPNALHVHAVKSRSESAGDNSPIQFVNKDKFQILHTGLDEEWGESEFEKMTAHGGEPPGGYLLYPDGPFTGEVADTIVNFSDNTTLEASQP
jgi:prepilin-type N-terminal cleavage/methylation domain-containing protein